MTEHLLERAAKIIALLESQPERGADQLIDFAKSFSSNLKLEDEVILTKLQLIWSNDAEEKQLAIKKLENLTKEVINTYNEKKLNEHIDMELALANKMKKRPIPNEIVVKAKNIKKAFPANKFRLTLDSLELRLGEITGVVGENANGKSTLLRILSGELAADSGELEFPLLDPSNKMLWGQLKKQIAYVPQELPSWNGLLKDNLRFEAAIHGVTGTANQEALHYISQRLGLVPYLDRTWSELSGGYKLRFALAKALIWNAKLLIIDEPLAFLDVKTQIVILNDLKNLAQSLKYPLAVLLSSQHLHEVEAVADQVVYVEKGVVKKFEKSRKEQLDEVQHNIFEIHARISFTDFLGRIETFDYTKIVNNGIHWTVFVPPNIKPQVLLSFLSMQGVEIDYFRDISSSVKSKFYE